MDTTTPPSERLAVLNNSVLNELAEAGALLRESLVKLSATLYDLTGYTPNDVEEQAHRLRAAAQVSTLMQSLYFQYGNLSKFLGDERHLRAAHDSQQTATKIRRYFQETNPDQPIPGEAV